VTALENQIVVNIVIGDVGN